jgi:hypothetical protein
VKVPDLIETYEAVPTLKALGLEEGTTYIPNLGRTWLDMRTRKKHKAGKKS